MGPHPGSRCLPRHPVRGALGNHRRCGGFGQPTPVRVHFLYAGIASGSHTYTAGIPGSSNIRVSRKVGPRSMLHRRRGGRDKQGQARTHIKAQGQTGTTKDKLMRSRIAVATRDKHAQEGATRTRVTRRWATDCRPIPSKLPPSSHRAAIKLPPRCHLVAAKLLTKLSYAAAAAKRQPPPSRKQPQAATSGHKRLQVTPRSQTPQRARARPRTHGKQPPAHSRRRQPVTN